MTAERIRVLLVDDHELARQGLRRMLELEEDIEVVGEASGVEKALEQAAILCPDIVLMDIKMPTSNGLEATRRLKERGMTGEVIMLSLYEEYLAQAIEAGAGGYLVKDVKREELANAIRRVHGGEMVLATSLLASPTRVQEALRRFQEVARRQAEGGGQRPPAQTSAPGSQAPAPYLDDTHDTGKGPQHSLLPDPTTAQAGTPTPAPGPKVNQGPASPQASIQQGTAGPTYHDKEAVRTAEAAKEEAPRQGVLEGFPRGESPEEVPTQTQGPGPYAEEAELVIPPPVDAHRLLLLSRKLHEQYHVEVLETVGSWEGGTWMKVMLRRPVALKEVLTQMTEVAQVWEAGPEDEGSLPRAGTLPAASTTSGTQLRLVLKIAGDPLQLALTM